MTLSPVECMADGGWRIEDGGWRMADGGWRMAGPRGPRGRESHQVQPACSPSPCAAPFSYTSPGG